MDQRFYEAAEAIQHDLDTLADQGHHEFHFHPGQIEAFVEYCAAALMSAPEAVRDSVIAWLPNPALVVSPRRQSYADDVDAPSREIGLFLSGGIIYVMHIHPLEDTWQPVNIAHGERIRRWEPPLVHVAHIMKNNIHYTLHDEVASAPGWEERMGSFIYDGSVPYPD